MGARDAVMDLPPWAYRSVVIKLPELRILAKALGPVGLKDLGPPHSARIGDVR